MAKRIESMNTMARLLACAVACFVPSASPVAVAAPDEIVYDGYLLELIRGENPDAMCRGSAMRGGIDAGLPGDVETIRLAYKDKRRKKAGVPESATFLFKTAHQAKTVRIVIGHGVYVEGCKRIGVFLDDKRIGLISCHEKRDTDRTSYSGEQGFGWVRSSAPLNAATTSAEDARHGDCVSAQAEEGQETEAHFRIDLPDGQYRVGPRALLPISEMDLPAATTQQFWLTVHVPPDAQPGRYSGTVELASRGRPVRRLALALEVLPFWLVIPKDRWHGVYWGTAYYTYDSEELVEAQFKDMQAHGITAVTGYADNHPREAKLGDDGTLECDLSNLARLAELRRKYGITGPAPTSGCHGAALRLIGGGPLTARSIADPKFQQAYRLYVDTVFGKIRREGWWEPLLYVWDEPSARNVLCDELMKTSRDLFPDLPIYLTCYRDTARKWDAQVNVRCYGLGNVNAETIEETKQSGDRLMFYSGAYGLGLKSDRLGPGLYMLKTDAEAYYCWAYCWPKGNIWFDLDNNERETGLVIPDQSSPIPTIDYEALREGIDDFRYAHTLRSLLAQARRRPQLRDAAARAERVLSDVLSRVPLDGKRVSAYANSLSGKTLDDWRRSIANEIVRLARVVGEGR